METGTASDDVTDAIASIEMHRQQTEKETGLAAACSEALRRLHELLERERGAQQHGPGTKHPANIEAVTAEIRRIRKLAGVTSQAPIPRNPRPGQPPASARSGTRIPPRNKGRRTMGRRGDR